jgi:putative peptidoglycan lipid II flippase
MISAISNVIMIVYLAFCGNFESRTNAVFGLAIAYLISWSAQFFTLTVPLLRVRRMPGISLKFRNEDLYLAGKRTLPVMLGAWLIPMTTLTANAFSSYVDVTGINGSISQGAAIVVFENAFSVFSIAGGLMTYGICNYLFPKLSAKFAGGDTDGFNRSARMGLSISVSVTVPIAIAVFILSDEIIRVLYLRGNFTEGLANAAAQSLKTLAIALPAYAVIEFLSRTSYSCGRVRCPMLGAIVGILSGLISASVFALTHSLSVATIALSAVLGLASSAITQIFCLRRLLFTKMSGKTLATTALSVAGMAVTALVMRITYKILKKILQNPNAFQNLVIIAIVFLMGFMVYLIWIFLFRKKLFLKTHPERRTLSDG